MIYLFSSLLFHVDVFLFRCYVHEIQSNKAAFDSILEIFTMCNFLIFCFALNPQLACRIIIFVVDKLLCFICSSL